MDPGTTDRAREQDRRGYAEDGQAEEARKHRGTAVQARRDRGNRGCCDHGRGYSGGGGILLLHGLENWLSETPDQGIRWAPSELRRVCIYIYGYWFLISLLLSPLVGLELRFLSLPSTAFLKSLN